MQKLNKRFWIIYIFLDILLQEEVVIDDSRKFGKPFELLIGRNFKLECWEECVKTMIPGEVSRFSCPVRCVIDYPTISRSLRDLYSGMVTLYDGIHDVLL